MYFEEAKVKKYHRKNSKEEKVPYFQINLPKDSKFNEVKPIGLIDISELEKLEGFLEANPIEEKEAEINELEEELNEVKQQLQEEKQQVNKLAEEVNELKEAKIKLQNDVITYKNYYEDKIEELSSEKEDSKGLLATITKLTTEKAEVEKENIFLKNRSLFNRLINKQYTKEDVEALPEEVNAEAKPSEE